MYQQKQRLVWEPTLNTTPKNKGGTQYGTPHSIVTGGTAGGRQQRAGERTRHIITCRQNENVDPTRRRPFGLVFSKAHNSGALTEVGGPGSRSDQTITEPQAGQQPHTHKPHTRQHVQTDGQEHTQRNRGEYGQTAKNGTTCRLDVDARTYATRKKSVRGRRT